MFNGKSHESIEVEGAEDLASIVSIISPFECEFLDFLDQPKKDAMGHPHIWSGTDKFGNKTEGNTPIRTFESRIGALAKTTAGHKHSLKDEEDYQMQERLREHLRDLEGVVINGAADIEAFKIHGLTSLISSHRTDCFGQELKADDVEQLIRRIYMEYGEAPNLILAGKSVRCIYTLMDGLKEVYMSKCGICRVIHSRRVPDGVVLILNSKNISVMPEFGKSFSYDRKIENSEERSGILTGSYTFQMLSENSHGIITGISDE